MLAVPLLVFGVVMGVAVLGMLGALWAAGEAVAAVPAVTMAVTVGVEWAAVLALLRHLRSATDLGDVVRATSRPGMPEGPSGAGSVPAGVGAP